MRIFIQGVAAFLLCRFTCSVCRSPIHVLSTFNFQQKKRKIGTEKKGCLDTCHMGRVAFRAGLFLDSGRAIQYAIGKRRKECFGYENFGSYGCQCDA